MSNEPKVKVKKQFRISEEIAAKLTDLSNETGKTNTQIVEEALLQYFEINRENEYEKIAEYFLKKYEEKYSAYMTRVRLGVRTADINSQLLVELLNSIFMMQGYRENAYFPTARQENPVLKEAREDIKQRIENAKQKKDNSKIERS